MPCCVSTLAARSTQTFCDKRPPLRLFHHRLGTRVLATTADAACIVDGDPRYLVPHSTAAKDGQRLPMAGSNTLPHRLHSPHNSLCRAGSHSAIIRPTLYGAHRHPPENAGTSLAGPTPPQSARIKRSFTFGYILIPHSFHHNTVASTAKAGVSRLVPTTSKPILARVS